MANGLSRTDWSSLRVLWDVGTLAGLGDGARLLARFADRHDEAAEIAFEVLVRRHGPMVLRVCEQLLHDRHGAEDAFQAVFMVLARRAGSIRRPEQLGPWLHGVALRTAKESRSRENKRRRLELRGGTMQPTASNLPEHPLVQVEEAQALHAEIARLPEHYRSPVVLCDLEGLTHQEAASRLRCPTGTIAIRIKRARERLRERLARRGLDPSSGMMMATLGPGTIPSLPTSLIESTVRGSMATGVASASVVSLAEGVRWTMTLAKWKTATAAAGLVLALGLAATWGASGGLQVGQKEAQPPVVPEVEVGQPVSREVSDYKEFAGRTEPSRSQEIRSNVGGTLEMAFFPEGKRVKTGELLFQIDRRESQAALDLADSLVLKAEARLKVALAALERNKQLLARKAIAQDEVDVASADLAEAKAALHVAEEARDRARTTLDSTRIKAPFDGVISPSLAHPGDRIKAVETSLAKLEATDPMAVAFDIDEWMLLRLRRLMGDELVGTSLAALPVQVTLVADESFSRRGTARFGGEPVDPSTGAARLRATIPNPGHVILPGMFVRVRLTTSKPHQALLVPESSIATVEDRKLLYLIGDRDVVEARPVTLGQAHDDLREVREGLKAKDRVVVGSLKDIRPGMTVKPRPAPRP